MRALERANEVRHARAELKRRIAGGQLSAAAVIVAPPSEACSWPLSEVLLSQRRWGPVKCRRFLASLQIDGRRPLGALTRRQRQLVTAALARRA